MDKISDLKYPYFAELSQRTANTKQQPCISSCGATQSPDKDTVEISGKDGKKSNKNLFTKIAVCVGTAAVLTAAVILGKKKIDGKKAKQLEEEAARKAKEVSEKLKAEKAEAERQAQARADELAAQARKAEEAAQEKARIAAEEAKNAERLAKQKIIEQAKSEGGIGLSNAVNYVKKDVKQADGIYNPDGTLNFAELRKAVQNGDKGKVLLPVMNMNYEMTYYSEGDISKRIIDSVRKMEESGVDYSGIKEVFGKTKLTTDEELGIIEGMGTLGGHNTLSIRTRLKANNEKINYINQRLANEMPKDGETATECITRVIKDFESEKLAKQQEHLRSVHSKIKYTDEPCVEYFAGDPNYKGPEVAAAMKYSSFEGNSCGGNEEFRRVFSTFPRYKAQEYFPNCETKVRDEYNGVKPLVRWMKTPSCEIDPKTGNIIQESFGYKSSESFVERFKVGEEYTLPMRQSCSKGFYATPGDNNFRDTALDCDIKLVFIPKSKNASKAVDIMEYGYKGNNGEAIYLPGEKFTVLDKRLEEIVNEYAEPGKGCRSSYRWVIEMQEK